MSPSSSSSPATELRNRSEEWRFTWEAQSHVPTLRLFLFNPDKPKLHATSLKADLLIEHFLLSVSFFDEAGADTGTETVLRVPLPRVLVDSDKPLQCRALTDHIEVKLFLLLPVDHPLVSDFESLLSEGSDDLRPLSIDSDIKKLSELEEVLFYCRHCSTKLTRALRCFEEMPSVNWLDVADNWFGSCCCSFGGISEKLVLKYAESYSFSPGVCHLSTTSAFICKHDLVGCEFPENGSKSFGHEWRLDQSVTEAEPARGTEHRFYGSNQSTEKQGINLESKCLYNKEDNLGISSEDIGRLDGGDNLRCLLPVSDTAENMDKSLALHTIEHHLVGCETTCCSSNNSESNLNEIKSGIGVALSEDQKKFLNGFLGNGFMAMSSGISKDIQWVEFLCPQCSSLLGAYPCSEDQAPLDGRVRLFKCNVSTGLPICGSNDVFKNYTLERMFTSQLLESARDELSFRTVVKDLKSKDTVLQIVLLNPNSWNYTGSCQHAVEPAVRMDLQPSVKVLFSVNFNEAESGSRTLAEQAAKNQADEVFMLQTQVKELITKLELTNNIYPSSHKILQGLLVSSLNRHA